MIKAFIAAIILTFIITFAIPAFASERCMAEHSKVFVIDGEEHILKSNPKLQIVIKTIILSKHGTTVCIDNDYEFKVLMQSGGKNVRRK